jgi:hypothetical protein
VVTRYVKRFMVVLGAMVLLLALVVSLGVGSRSRNLKIAADLLELHRRIPTRHTDQLFSIDEFFRGLTNLPFKQDLPFKQGYAGPQNAWVNQTYGLLGMHFRECYFIYCPLPDGSAQNPHSGFTSNDNYFLWHPLLVTNACEWTLYHAWYWNGDRELAKFKLLTISGK